MSFRIPAIEVPSDKPFTNDALSREKIVHFVAGIVAETGGQPLVLAIDSPYGTGKSTFVDMLGKVLIQRNVQTVYFNAWKADHVSDPLIAMVAALDEAFPSDNSLVAADNMARVRKVAGIVVKHAAKASVKFATAGLLQLPDDIEEALADTAADTTSDVVEAFEKEEEAAKCFRAELEKVVAKLPDMNKEPTLVFFIDELDRCRPDFAMSLLERVKHMFDVPNLAFVLSVDKKQLEAVTAAVYGEKIDAGEYLRKFIDLEFGLPSPQKSDFIKNTIKRAGLNTEFERRQFTEKDNIVKFLSVLASVYDMSLRAIERCIVRLKLVIAATPHGHGLDSIQVALLIVLRSVDKDMFEKLVKRTIDPIEAMKYFRSLPGTRGQLNGHEGNILEALLVADLCDAQAVTAYRQTLDTIIKDASSSREQQLEAQHKLSLVGSFTGGWGSRGTIARVAATIDIAANIRD